MVSVGTTQLYAHVSEEFITILILMKLNNV